MASILIVEDAFDASEAMANYLRKAGHEVKCVGNGREALADVIMSAPGVGVLDWLLPEMDVPSFWEVIRLYLRTRSLKFVVMVGIPDSRMVKRIRKVGVNSVLVKG